MGRKSQVSFDSKKQAVMDYLNNQRSLKELARDYQVHIVSVRDWISNFRALGDLGITISQNTVYSKELKLMAVVDYLSGKQSQREICQKYKIRSRRQLRDWIRLYNGHKEIKSSTTGGSPIMTKGRNTTFEERIEIVKYCIEHNCDYNQTAIKYHVSYQQVRSWAIKYEKLGVDALTDRRGKRKPEDQLTEVELLKAQNKLLEAKNKRLEMENELLKKLEEIERGWS